MRRIALVLLMAVALSGCFGFGSSRLSEASARAAVEGALEDFAADFAAPDGGALQKVHGDFSTSADAPFAGDVGFEAEWGTQDRSRVTLEIVNGGVTFTLAIHCSPGSVVLTWGDQRLERRPEPGRSCLQSAQESGDPFGADALHENEIRDVDAHKDGSVTATLAGDEGDVRVHVDPRGRLEWVEFDTPQGGGRMEAEYGTRGVIDMPPATARMPALIFGAGVFDGTYRWQAGQADESVPFSEVQVRVRQDNQTVQAFDVQPGTQEAGGFTFTFSDDGDGRFGSNDTFTISSPQWTQQGQYDVVVWDTWADAEMGEVPIPGVWVLAPLAAAALGKRCSKKP